jgi:hypothetical protein
MNPKRKIVGGGKTSQLRRNQMNRLLRTSAKGTHADGGNVAAVSLSIAES